jgi:hypothetical protein
MIPLDEVNLLLRGWADEQSRLRVVAQSPEMTFSAFCTVYKAEGARVAFWIGKEDDKSMIDFLLTDCLFEFGDSPSGEADLPVGGKVESGIVGARGDFNITIMLLTS